MRPVVATAVVLAALTFGSAQAATYYVRPGGNDRASGRSVVAAWRTVARVNAAHLRAGDRVLFAGGAVFGDTVLDASPVGTRRARVRFGSYGRGKATLTGGIRLRSARWVTVADLAVTHAGQAVLGSVYGTGSKHVVLRGLDLDGVGIGINSANVRDSDWRIVRTHIAHTGDSGMIVLGSGFTIARDVITDTGLSPSITYAKHGIYLKGPRARIVGNTILRFSTSAISLRSHDALVAGNHIDSGPVGIGYFQESRRRGLTRVVGNSIRGISSVGIYLDGSSSESFRISRNAISGTATATAILAHRVPAFALTRNLIASPLGRLLQIEAPQAYVERGNVWRTITHAGVFIWNGVQKTFSGYRAASGEGAGDTLQF